MPSKPSYDAGASGPQRKKKRSRPMVINLNGDVAAQFARYETVANDEKPADQAQRWVTEPTTLPELEELLNRDKS